MLKGEYQLYVKDIIKLVKSFVIKSEITATSINARMLSLGIPVDLDDESTWKYYLNLSGQYHSADTPIKIISSDTQTEIELTKANLLSHPITAIEYGPNGINHTRLRRDNNRMDVFISGVFSNITLSQVLNAEDHQLLYWDNSRIAMNEIDLIPEVQKFIYNYVDRWNVGDYSLGDSLYQAAFYAGLVMNLVNEVRNIRLSFCNTPQVCEFHLWAELKGLYGLDAYRDTLTLPQALWFYRNMRHIILYTGRERILEALIEHIATPSNLDALKYDYIKTEQNLLNSLVPDGRFTVRPYNDSRIDITEDDVVTEAIALFESIDEAPDNREEFDQDLEVLTDLPNRTTINEFPVGQVKFVPATNLVADLLNDVQYKLDYWVYLCSLNMFTGVYTFDIPDKGPINLTAKEALILYIYANSKAIGIDLETIPEPRVSGVVRVINPTFDDLRPFAGEDMVTDDDIVEALSDLVAPRSVSSLAELESFTTDVINRRIRHNLQFESKPFSDHESHMKDIVDGIYNTLTVKLLLTETRYIDWFDTIKFSGFGVSSHEWHDISLIILKTLLDIEPGLSSLPSAQRNLIDIIDSVSGYGILITAGESASGYQTIPWAFSDFDDKGNEVTVDITAQLSELHFEDSVWPPYGVDIGVDMDMATFEVENTEEGVTEAELSYGLYYSGDRILDYTLNVEVGGFFTEDIEIEHIKV